MILLKKFTEYPQKSLKYQYLNLIFKCKQILDWLVFDENQTNFKCFESNTHTHINLIYIRYCLFVDFHVKLMIWVF